MLPETESLHDSIFKESFQDDKKERNIPSPTPDKLEVLKESDTSFGKLICFFCL